MSSFMIIIVFCATLLFNSGLARPRAPQSPRFPPFSDNSVGEFVLWSCTATAQLQRNNNNVDKNIIHIAPAPVDLPTIRFRVPSDLPSREDDDSINNINIIKVDSFPHRNRGRPGVVPINDNNKKPTFILNTETNDHGTIKNKNVVNPMLDSPLKTIRVNAFRKDRPILFREKPQLPEVEYRPMKENESSQHSSEITVIKP